MLLINKTTHFLCYINEHEVVDQMTDMILCSLNYFVYGEQLAGTEIPERRGQVRVQPLLTSHRQKPETLCIQMGSDVGGFNDSVVVEKQGHNGTVSTNRNCQRQTTNKGEWNPRPSAYQPYRYDMLARQTT